MFYPLPESGTGKNSVPDCMTDATETGTIFPVTVFGTGFWYVCHGPNVTLESAAAGSG